MTPFAFSLAWWRNAAVITKIGLDLADTARASGIVVRSRTQTMREAICEPVTADHSELARMVPEKVDAFYQGALLAFGEWSAWQRDAVARWQRIAGAAVTGGTMSLDDLETASEGAMGLATVAVSASAKALAPIHDRARSNARRLRRSKAA